MTILNLGCGTKTSASPDVVNVDWSIYLRLRRCPLLRAVAPLVLRGERLARFRSLPANIVVHNLAKRLPFRPDSADAVYHSHLLEHLDRDVAEKFLLEIRRVLKPGGIHRIVVPDMEKVCGAYLSHIGRSERDPAEAARHDGYVAAIIEQSVRKAAYASTRQGRLANLVENALIGDARRRGETHQWMYDRISLSALLLRLGYRSPRICTHDTSAIPGWPGYALDLGPGGVEYKPDSLYIEAEK